MVRLSKTALPDTLVADARDLREQAALLPPGRLREELLRKARQTETAAHASEWMNSSGLLRPE